MMIKLWFKRLICSAVGHKYINQKIPELDKINAIYSAHKCSYCDWWKFHMDMKTADPDIMIYLVHWAEYFEAAVINNKGTFEYKVETHDLSD